MSVDFDAGPTAGVLAEVCEERARQHAEWGQQDHFSFRRMCEVWPEHGDEPVNYNVPDTADKARRRCEFRFRCGIGSFADVFIEEVAELLEERDPEKLRAELLQAIAVGVQWVEAIDRGEQS